MKQLKFEEVKHLLRPTLVEKAKNLATAVVKQITAGLPMVSDEEYNRKIGICNGCEFFQKERKTCGKCGCGMEMKAKWGTSKCPIGKW